MRITKRRYIEKSIYKYGSRAERVTWNWCQILHHEFHLRLPLNKASQNNFVYLSVGHRNRNEDKNRLRVDRQGILLDSHKLELKGLDY